jgi:serine/threonine protein kinase/Tfp pilus assembly protein PilF
MNPPSAATSRPASGLEDLIEELTGKLHAGGPVDVEVYAARHPEHAAQLRDLFPALQVLAGLSRSGGARASGVAPPAASEGGFLTGVLGDFRILREVGRGGMGVVYEAEQLSLGRRVALKVLPFAATMDPRHLQRFKNEALAAASLHHTNIAPVFAVGCERGVHFYAMQLIDGCTLADVIRRMRGQAPEAGSAGQATVACAPADAPPMGDTTPDALAEFSTRDAARGAGLFRRVAEWGVQAAEALEHAHQLGFVHRDVKPANLMLDALGRLWVTDFGLAQMRSDVRLTRTGDLVGTLRYMSPEQALGGRDIVDHRTDVYALGATLYELLTREPAFGGDDAKVLLRRIAEEDPRPPRGLDRSVPAELETIVLKAMAKEPAARYATAQALADDLQRFLADKPIQARRPTWGQAAAKWMRRHRAAVWTAAAVGVAAFVALAVCTGLLWREQQATKAALARADAKNRWARRAVNDMYEDVAEKWLDHETDMTDLQLQFLHKAVEFYEELVREEHTDPAERLEAGIAYLRLAAIYDSAFGQREEALADYGRAVALFEGLAAERPGEPTYRRQLACGYQALGEYLRCHTLLPEAETYLLRSHPLLVDLARQFPDAPEHQDDLANNQENLGLLFGQTNRTEEAKAAFLEAIRIHELLKDKFPEATEYRVRLAWNYHHLAELSEDMGRLSDAVRLFRKSLDLFEEARGESASTPAFRSGLGGGGYNGLATLLLELNRPEEAEKAVNRSLEIRRQARADFPKLLHVWNGLAFSWWTRGRLLSRLGRPAEAEDAYREALVLQQKVADSTPGSAGSREELALMNSGLAWLYLIGPEQVRDARKAVPLVDQALSLAPNSGAYAAARGVAYYRLGEYTLAVTRLREAIGVNDRTDQTAETWVADVHSLRRESERNGRMAVALNWFFLAMSYQRLGEPEKAGECYRQALQRRRQLPADPDRDPALNAVEAEAAALLGVPGGAGGKDADDKTPKPPG